MIPRMFSYQVKCYSLESLRGSSPATSSGRQPAESPSVRRNETDMEE